MRTAFLAICVVVNGMIFAQPPELSPVAETFIEEHFTQAKRAEAFQQFPTAIEEYNLIVKRYPSAVPEVYQNLGLVYYLLHRYDEAIGVFERGIKLKPTMVGARLFLGSSYLVKERPREALPHLQYAYKNQPNTESAEYLGLCLNSLRRYEEANEFYRVALGLSENKAYFLHLLGNSYLRLSEQLGNTLSERYPDSTYEFLITAKVTEAQQWYQIAAQEYLEAAKRDPMNASLFFMLGRLLAVLGNDKASTQALARYRELAPIDANVELGELPRKEMADVGTAIDYEAELGALPKVNRERLPLVPILPGDVNAELQKRIAAPSGSKWKRVVDDLLHSRWAQSAEALKSIRALPRDWLRDYLLTSVALWQEDALQAEAAAHSLKPIGEKTPAVQMLGWDLYRQLSDNYFQRLLDEYPQSAWAHYLKGRTLSAQGKLQAADEYKAAIAADPALPEAHIALADFYLSNSKLEEALAECMKELELNANSSLAKVRIGRIFVQQREAEKAIPYLEAALKQDPDDANSRADLGQAMDLRGDTDRAIAEYQRALKLDPSLNRIHYILARLYRKNEKPDLAERENKMFRTNEVTARQQGLDHLHQVRDAAAPKDGHP